MSGTEMSHKEDVQWMVDEIGKQKYENSSTYIYAILVVIAKVLADIADDLERKGK